ncbi:MAG: OmpH family outer membrane protein [Bacteroidales bacterium]|nr:OmpH family outer membrane protein [Bacteroidales bacterium]
MDEQINETLEQNSVQEEVKSADNNAELKQTITKLKKDMRKAYLMFSVIVIVIVIALLLVVFFGRSSEKKESATAQPVKTIQKGDLKIAYVNTDTIMVKYQYAKDLEAGLKTYQQQIENEVRAAANKLQRDYEDYMKNGDKLTLTKQKEKEKELTERQQQLPALQQEMAAKLQERQYNDNKKLVDAIYAFIDEYNKTHDNFNLILRKEYMNSPVLYIDSGMDITNEIINGLNEEYKSVKGK